MADEISAFVEFEVDRAMLGGGIEQCLAGQVRLDFPEDDREVSGFGAPACDRRLFDRTREFILRQILDGRQRLTDGRFLWRHGRRRGGGGLIRIVLRLWVLVRRQFAFRLGLEIVRGGCGLAFLLVGGVRLGGRRGRFWWSPRIWRGGGGLGGRLCFRLLVGRFAVDLFLGRGCGRVIGRLFVQGLRRRLRFLLRRLRLGRRWRRLLDHAPDRNLLNGGRSSARPERVVEEERDRDQDMQDRRRNERDHVEPALGARRRLGQVEALDRLGDKVGLGQQRSAQRRTPLANLRSVSLAESFMGGQWPNWSLCRAGRIGVCARP